MGIFKFGGLGYSGYFVCYGMVMCVIDVFVYGFDILEMGVFNKILI